MPISQDILSKHMNQGNFTGTWHRDVGKNSFIVDTVLYHECGLQDTESGDIVYFPIPETEEDLVTLIRLLGATNATS